MNMIFRKLNEITQIPTPQTKGAACADIHADLSWTKIIKIFDQDNIQKVIYTAKHIDPTLNTIDIPPFTRALIPTGWAVKIPPDHSLRIYSRSGLAWKRGLVVFNGCGIVDVDYRDEVFVILYNSTNAIAEVKHGDRIAQMDLAKNLQYSVDVSEVICDDSEWYSKDNDRVGGFGSTGF